MSASSRLLFPLLCALALHSGWAAGQSYPSKTVRVIVPFQAGGSTDVVFRILAPRLTEQLGQQVLVDNRPGGGATIGMDMVAKSPPDGHTLGVATVSFACNPFILSKIPFDTEKDLVPVSLVTKVPHVLTVHPSVPARSVKELIALAKARPGSLLYATGGNASSNHLATELFAYMAGVKLVHVPYKGAGSALTSIVSGETAMMVATLASAVQHFKTGRLIPLGMSTLTRDPTLPGVPTVAEAGVPGYEVFEWHGVVVPAGTPAAVITRLHQEIVKALAVPEVRERIVGVGAQPVGSTPAELAAHIKKELATWSKVVKAAGVRVD
jgi:tripartite-type tricarboxylate transporter receptor subunit TctC